MKGGHGLQQALRLDAIPAEHRRRLDRAGYDDAWFEAQRRTMQMTVVIIYSTLERHGLWHHVASESSSSLGALEFHVHDVHALMDDLRNKKSFSSRRTTSRLISRDIEWSARERTERASLHFKQFRHWPQDKVQAHIDPTGTDASGGWWRRPRAQAFLLWRHWRDFEGYRDVERIATLMVDHGLGEDWWSDVMRDEI